MLNIQAKLVVKLLALIWVLVTSLTPADVAAQTKPLQQFDNCKFIETDWCDGDSFRVKNRQGKEFTLRLYGVDCVETRIQDDTDSRRLRSQRRYFGISNLDGSPRASIAAAKRMGNEARKFVIDELQTPFTVVTAFADARGDGKFKRYYGFITTHTGHDLAERLVQMGHARAFGVSRGTIDGRSRDEFRESLNDLEFQAATRRSGIWKSTDWESLPEQRRVERKEAAELDLAKETNLTPDASQKISLNSAPRDVMMQLPGVGETIANRIIEGRPYKSIDSLIEVHGIGAKKLQQIRSFLILNN